MAEDETPLEDDLPSGDATGGDTSSASKPETEDLAAQSLARALTTSFGLLKLVMLLIVVFVLVNCIQTVDEGYIGLKQRFGAYVMDADGIVEYQPGSVFVWPAPIESLRLIPKGPQTLILDEEFWPLGQDRKKIKDETPLLPEPSLRPNASAYNITGDRNIVHSQWKIEYRIVDPVRYVQSTADVLRQEYENVSTLNLRREYLQTPEDLVRQQATSSIMSVLAGMSVDTVLRNTGQSKLLARVRAHLARAMQNEVGERWGIRIEDVNIHRVAPPGATKPMFDAVSSARSDKESKITEARQRADETLAKSRTQANAIILAAELFRERVVKTAQSDATTFKALLAKFPGDPQGLQAYLVDKRHTLNAKLMKHGHVTYIAPDSKAVIMIGASPTEAVEKDNE